MLDADKAGSLHMVKQAFLFLFFMAPVRVMEGTYGSAWPARGGAEEWKVNSDLDRGLNKVISYGTVQVCALLNRAMHFAMLTSQLEPNRTESHID